MSTQDDDRLRLLSDSERAAMEDNDYDPEEDNKAALAEIGRGNLDNGGDDEDDDNAAAAAPAPAAAPVEAPAASPAAAPAEAPAAAPSDGDVPADELTPAPSPAAQTAYKSELPKDYEDQVKANREALTDLRKKFDDGELDAAEFHTKFDELQDQRADLRDLKNRAKLAAEMQQQAESNAWVNTINTFVAEAATKAELGIVDYSKDAAKQADLDTFVKALGNAPGNENKPMRWFLEEAHKRVVALHNIPTTKKAPADTKRKPDASGVVQNLSDVPGGGGDADPVGDEFVELDKLNGLDYERALSKLSPEKREQYLRT